jgi:hypothetical protein
MNNIRNLLKLRQEFEETGEGKSLIEMTAPVGLLLHDACNLLGLNEKQRREILGAKLEHELNQYLGRQLEA